MRWTRTSTTPCWISWRPRMRASGRICTRLVFDRIRSNLTPIFKEAVERCRFSNLAPAFAVKAGTDLSRSEENSHDRSRSWLQALSVDAQIVFIRHQSGLFCILFNSFSKSCILQPLEAGLLALNRLEPTATSASAGLKTAIQNVNGELRTYSFFVMLAQIENEFAGYNVSCWDSWGCQSIIVQNPSYLRDLVVEDQNFRQIYVGFISSFYLRHFSSDFVEMDASGCRAREEGICRSQKTVQGDGACQGHQAGKFVYRKRFCRFLSLSL